ncbi:MAG: rhomboid family intramembrane serine protease [Elusimicrobia bacterium]|nr:rhomboid family intramembrane serine protease [Elusimicrobiota bacterium]
MSFSLRLPALNDLPPVTKALVMTAFGGWALEMAFSWTLNYYLGLVPLKVIKSGWLWQIFTYILIHAGFWHFFFNAFMLWFLGPALEPVMGSRKYLIYFIFCGAVSGLFTALVTPASATPVVGASGAIYGLLYAFAALYPDQIVYLYFFFPMTARQLVFFLAGISLVLSFAAAGSGVANFTHLSGLIAGWLYFQAPSWLEKVTSHKSQVTSRWSQVAGELPEGPADAEVDAILDKISGKGEGALTDAERRKLDEYAKRKGGRA